MKDRDYKNIIEAMLFAAGDEIQPGRIAAALEIDNETVERLLGELREEYQGEHRGIMLRDMNGSWQMCTNPLYFENVRLLFEKIDNKNLSQAAYETLAVIAYNTEATRAKVDAVRGVNSGSSISTLADKGLIEEAGRLDAPGRPVVYRPSMEFYRAFGFKSLDDLIPVDIAAEGREEDPKVFPDDRVPLD
ncbi:MAG: SMC-Scp complex subunit ScpB [Clostridia bacterium]|nr:SMC-Scp complex subunit ScpB [Clostridia bacterium]MBN2881960.1 SMC-Scp complex subunit ScpB [Clostridia bacterium]